MEQINLSQQSVLSGASVSLVERPFQLMIGLIALSTDMVSEQDFAAMRPSPDIAIYVNRVKHVNPSTRENLRQMQPLLGETAAAIVLGEPLDVIAYSCTSAAAIIGDENVRQAVVRHRPDTLCVTPTSGGCACTTLGVSRVGILTPYTAPVSTMLGHYFTGLGLKVVSIRHIDIADDRQVARISHSSIIKAALDVDQPDMEALFISCTALRATPLSQNLKTG